MRFGSRRRKTRTWTIHVIENQPVTTEQSKTKNVTSKPKPKIMLRGDTNVLMDIEFFKIIKLFYKDVL